MVKIYIPKRCQINVAKGDMWVLFNKRSLAIDIFWNTHNLDILIKYWSEIMFCSIIIEVPEFNDQYFKFSLQFWRPRLTSKTQILISLVLQKTHTIESKSKTGYKDIFSDVTVKYLIFREIMILTIILIYLISYKYYLNLHQIKWCIDKYLWHRWYTFDVLINVFGTADTD